MSTKKKPRVGDKGYTGNPNGRPADRLKGLTPAELKQSLNKIKRVTPKAVDILVKYMEVTEGVAQAKAASELLRLFMALDAHTVKRAADVQRLLNEIDKRNDDELDGADEAFEEDENSPAAVFTLHVQKD